MSARPSPGAVLCRLDALADPGARGFVFVGREDRFAGFVVRRGEAVQGWIDRCPHVGTPLAWRDHDYLTTNGSLILCASHGALFRVEDGLCVGGPCAGASLRPWPVAVVAGEVRAA